MLNPENKVGPLRIRAWALIVNMFANAIALFALSCLMAGFGGWSLLVVGLFLTVAAIGIAAKPVE